MPSVLSLARLAALAACTATAAGCGKEPRLASAQAREEKAVRRLQELKGKVDALGKERADLEKQLEAAGAPWTPGRVPQWSDQ